MIHTEIYQIRNYETDRYGQLTLLALANYLQHAADRHAIQLGVGMPALAQQGLSWVLHRMKINVTRWPVLGEEVTVETHPSGLEKVYVYRDFRMYDADRNLVATATSTWLVFDTAKRALTTPAPGFQEIFAPYKDFAFLPRASGKLSLTPTDVPLRCEVQARHNEIDTNDHINNSVYFQWMLEPLPTGFLHNYRCVEVDIVFKKECNREDRVESKVYQLDSTSLLHLLSNHEGKEVAIGTTTWQEFSL